MAGSASIGAGPAGAGDAGIGICCNGDLAPAAATGGGTGAGAMLPLAEPPAPADRAVATAAPVALAALCELIQCEARAANIEGANISAEDAMNMRLVIDIDMINTRYAVRDVKASKWESKALY